MRREYFCNEEVVEDDDIFVKIVVAVKGGDIFVRKMRVYKGMSFQVFNKRPKGLTLCCQVTKGSLLYLGGW